MLLPKDSIPYSLPCFPHTNLGQETGVTIHYYLSPGPYAATTTEQPQSMDSMDPAGFLLPGGSMTNETAANIHTNLHAQEGAYPPKSVAP